MVGVISRMTTVVTLVARYRVDSVHVLTKDSAVTGAQLCQVDFVFLGSVCSAVAMSGGRPLSSFIELLSIVVLTEFDGCYLEVIRIDADVCRIIKAVKMTSREEGTAKKELNLD